MPNETEAPRLMSLQEVAATLHVSPHTIRMWTRKGRIHPTRICRRLLYTPEEIRRFVSEAQ